MATHRIPTFRINEDMLVGAKAQEAWIAQPVLCNCGCPGDAAYSIDGTANDLPASWLGCPYCAGTAVGRPLVFRTADQIRFEL